MLEVVSDHTCFLGEGPVWDHRNKMICWVDISSGEIHQWNTLSKTLQTIPAGQLIGAIAMCEDGHFIAALKNGIALINRNSGAIDHLIHPEAHITGNRFNDGKCDPMGRFWIGSMSIDELPDLGSLYMLDQHLNLQKKVENATISNGMVWSPDHRFFYYIDTPTRQVVAYEYDLSTGEISNKTIVVEFDSEDGFPDGMTIDCDGMLWIAHWGGWQVSRWNPISGQKIFSLNLPVANVTSCVFGGDMLSDLYITTAKKGLGVNELEEQPLAGSLFVLKNTSYQGMKAHEFKTNSR